jgi:hypothetical protein
VNRPLATSLLLLPFAIAGGLYATGTLDRMNFAVDRYRWGVRAPHPGPGRYLEQYAGWWQRDHVPDFGKDWAERIIVRIEGKRAWLRIWHRCPPNYCEQGEFEATVHGKSGAIYALEVTRRREPQVMWTITLRPNGDNPNMLIITDERRAKDPYRNPMDNQSSSTSMRRVK